MMDLSFGIHHEIDVPSRRSCLPDGNQFFLLNGKIINLTLAECISGAGRGNMYKYQISRRN
jgi:hypothetical protein